LLPFYIRTAIPENNVWAIRKLKKEKIKEIHLYTQAWVWVLPQPLDVWRFG
jgi:hypothetical protein